MEPNLLNRNQHILSYSPDLYYPTKRAWYARAEGIDLDGKKKIVEGEGLLGRCIQHECDHLDGHLYLDRLERDVRKQAMRDIRQLRVSSALQSL